VLLPGSAVRKQERTGWGRTNQWQLCKHHVVAGCMILGGVGTDKNESMDFSGLQLAQGTGVWEPVTRNTEG